MERMSVPRTLIANATVFDATGAQPFVGDVMVEGSKIAAVTPAGRGGAGAPADKVIDGTGKFLMPGMVEGHAH